MDSTSDAVLLDRLVRGDSLALGRLYERYKLPLFRFCLRMLKDGTRAEDAVHDTFLKLARQHAGITHPDALRGWLFRVARNEVYMALRRTPHEPLDDDGALWDATTPQEILERTEQQVLVRMMLDSLRPEYREVLILREFEDLCYADIARVTGSTENAVRARIFKARRAMAERLAGAHKEQTT